MLKCYPCGEEMKDLIRCTKCGAERQISQTTGNVIWMRRGRLISAFQDEKEAWIEMAKRWKVSRELWPDRFKD